MSYTFLSLRNISIIGIAIIICQSHNVDGALVYRVMQLKDTDQVPAERFKIDVIPEITSFLRCLLKCEQNSDCQTVVHQGETCSIYNTTNGFRSKLQAESVASVSDSLTVTRN